mmetsp:Transcript_2585/g.7191  ORF Transcript_2585/g.7191 Transcript_2585/m.7191 type:complete len:362 (-) Transcript_2585:425-1510(-)
MGTIHANCGMIFSFYFMVPMVSSSLSIFDLLSVHLLESLFMLCNIKHFTIGIALGFSFELIALGFSDSHCPRIPIRACRSVTLNPSPFPPAQLHKIETPLQTEVNKIYTFEKERWILIAKSDLSKLHVWNLQQLAHDHKPCATLAGHKAEACESNFALDTSSERGRVISGDRGGSVLLWDLAAGSNSLAVPGSLSGDFQPLRRFEGHSKTVEDVRFNPTSHTEFCSVGDDGLLLFWDERSGGTPVTKVLPWCQVDLHCVDWNAADNNLLVTGTADGSTYILDRRQVGQPLRCLRGHREAVFRVGWRPGSTRHFASAGEDAHLIIWDITRGGGDDNMSNDQRDGSESAEVPPEIILDHAGHR